MKLSIYVPMQKSYTNHSNFHHLTDIFVDRCHGSLLSMSVHWKIKIQPGVKFVGSQDLRDGTAKIVILDYAVLAGLQIIRGKISVFLAKFNKCLTKYGTAR